MEFYATLGDACAKRKTLEQLFQAGMTGVRVNLSHTSLVKCAPLLEKVYWPAARRAGRPDAHLILDLEGPELRVGELPGPSPCGRGRSCARSSWPARCWMWTCPSCPSPIPSGSTATAWPITTRQRSSRRNIGELWQSL